MLKTAWEILMDNTDPRYVAAEVDVFWSSDAFDDVTGTQTAALINRYPTRVQLLHIKDGIGIAAARHPPESNSRGGSPRATGTGELDFRPIFAAANNRVHYYHQEHDGGTLADAEHELHEPEGLGSGVGGDDAGPAGDVPDGRGRHAGGGERGAGHGREHRRAAADDHERTIGADALDAGAAGDFAIVSQNCTAAPVPAGAPARARRRAPRRVARRCRAGPAR